MKLTIGHLYPDLLNLYGDRGNIQCLMRRCQWRGIEAETIAFELGDKIDFSRLDIVLLGGGSDREQMLVCEKLKEIQKDFNELYPNVTIYYSADSSGTLQTQIEEGLEADVFMSAAKKQMTALDEEGMIASDTITDLLENKIVLIVPTRNEKKLEKFEDIENADSIALGDPASVPAGQYAQEALTNLGIWDKIQDKVSFGTNVTEVLNQVAAASADAGIVYATDAASMADQVEVVAEAPEGRARQGRRAGHGDRSRQQPDRLRPRLYRRDPEGSGADRWSADRQAFKESIHALRWYPYGRGSLQELWLRAKPGASQDLH